MTKPKTGKNRQFHFRQKGLLVIEAMKGKDIFPVLEMHGITWEEFRGWYEAYKAEGMSGLKIRANRRRKSAVASS